MAEQGVAAKPNRFTGSPGKWACSPRAPRTPVPSRAGPAGRTARSPAARSNAARSPRGTVARMARLAVEVQDTDISALAVCAVVNAANDHLWMGSGVAGALKARGGPELERAAIGRGPIPVGTAAVTRGYGLAARWVIHAAVMGQDLRTDEVLIRRCTHEALEVAERLGCDDVALPAFGTGVGGVPLERCAQWMAEVVERHEARSLHRVVLAVRGEEARQAFAAAVERVAADPPPRRADPGELELDD